MRAAPTAWLPPAVAGCQWRGSAALVSLALRHYSLKGWHSSFDDTPCPPLPAEEGHAPTHCRGRRRDTCRQLRTMGAGQWHHEREHRATRGQPAHPVLGAALPRGRHCVCGQALLSGADTAMVIAIAAANGQFTPCTTVDLTINYMRPIRQADALLQAKLMRLGKTLAFCVCELRQADSNKPAAFSTGTYAILT